MADILKYLDSDFKGRPLSEINPGSKEIAFTIENALTVLEILKDKHVEILGGDFMSEKNGRFGYAHHLWGDQYYVAWYCDKSDKESTEKYLNRCYIKAKEYILLADKIAKQLKAKFYIVFVIGNSVPD